MTGHIIRGAEEFTREKPGVAAQEARDEHTVAVTAVIDIEDRGQHGSVDRAPRGPSLRRAGDARPNRIASEHGTGRDPGQTPQDHRGEDLLGVVVPLVAPVLGADLILTDPEDFRPTESLP